MTVREVLDRDAIPSVDDPTFDFTTFCTEDDRVIVLDADPARAYPVRMLHYHEIVNDRLSDRAVAVTWCPLCGSAVVYDRRVGDRTLTFGVSGKLADDDLVMYDRETETEWKQSSGHAIAGPLSGTDLEALPAAVMTLAAFREAHPDGVVLQAPGGESEAGQRGGEAARIRYDADPYDAYFEGAGFGLDAHRGTGTGDRDWNRDDLAPKDPVVGLTDGETAVGVPEARVRAAGGALSVTVGSRSVVVFVAEDTVAVYRDPGFRIEPTGDEGFTGDGTEWDPATGRAADGRRLGPVAFRSLFAFAWQDDHGPDSFHA